MNKNDHPLYWLWHGMHQRCANPKHVSFASYGGRGISVCERWSKFDNFLADMGHRPPGRSLDRINNDGNYEPSNCRWATTAEQLKNRRKAKPFARDWPRACGERQGQSVLKERDVVEIRRRFAAGEIKTSIAKSFGVTRQNIRSIVLKLTWKHV